MEAVCNRWWQEHKRDWRGAQRQGPKYLSWAWKRREGARLFKLIGSEREQARERNGERERNRVRERERGVSE